MYYSLLKFSIVKAEEGEETGVEGIEILNLTTLFEMIRDYINDHDILHKVFIIN
jgi:hypothetical protein